MHRKKICGRLLQTTMPHCCHISWGTEDLTHTSESHLSVIYISVEFRFFCAEYFSKLGHSLQRQITVLDRIMLCSDVMSCTWNCSYSDIWMVIKQYVIQIAYVWYFGRFGVISRWQLSRKKSNDTIQFLSLSVWACVFCDRGNFFKGKFQFITTWVSLS